MPGFNQTGPRGQGSGTGRGLGRCKQKPGQAFGPRNGQGKKGCGHKRNAAMENFSGRGMQFRFGNNPQDQNN